MRWGFAFLGVALWAGAVAAEPEPLNCLIQPNETVTLSFAVEGVVAEVLVDRGDLVERGDVLAKLDARVEAANLQVARARAASVGQVQGGQARLAYAERALGRHSELQSEGVVSDGVYDEVLREQEMAKAALLDAREARKVARLEVDRAAAILAMRSVRSPFKGVVVEKILGAGEWADPPQVLKLAEIDPLRVEVFAPLGMLGRVEVGTRATIIPEEPVGGAHQARVTVVDRVVDAASGTFGVRLELPNPDHALPAGVKCRVRFDEGVAVAPAPVAAGAGSGEPGSAVSQAAR
jgi:RND family efflux transporter MFP subunit